MVKFGVLRLSLTRWAVSLAFLCPSFGMAQTDSLLSELHKVIEKQDDYTDARLARIDALHQRLSAKMNSETRFEVLKGLTAEYETFIYDSAFSIISRLKSEAYKLDHPDKIAYAKVKLGLILLSAGMFKETLDSLGSFTVKGISDSIKIDYYFALARGYYDLGDFNRDPYYTPLYVSRGNAYIDSARNLCKPGDFLATYLRALRNLKNENTIDAKNDLTLLLSNGKLTDHEVAVTASTLSHYYIVREDYNTAIDLLLRSAIADIRSATKETAAMSSLAEFLYKTGDVQNAYIFIQQAMDDAVFYGARQRQARVGSILPVIAAAKLSNIEEQRKLWLIYSTIITLLSLLVIVFSISTYKQLKKRKVAERALQEANKIKEEYIGYYFNINSEYLSKIEAFKKSIEMKLMTKKFEDIRLVVGGINPKKEREELYHSFDKVFLKLFPDFVTVFNSYFKEEDRIQLKEGQLLNTELRIFALIRMGIHDSEKIAKILDYSINTIYNYKARVKGKSILPNDEFERKVMEIHAL